MRDTLINYHTGPPGFQQWVGISACFLRKHWQTHSREQWDFPVQHMFKGTIMIFVHTPEDANKLPVSLFVPALSNDIVCYLGTVTMLSIRCMTIYLNNPYHKSSIWIMFLSYWCYFVFTRINVNRKYHFCWLFELSCISYHRRYPNEGQMKPARYYQFGSLRNRWSPCIQQNKSDIRRRKKENNKNDLLTRRLDLPSMIHM